MDLLEAVKAWMEKGGIEIPEETEPGGRGQAGQSFDIYYKCGKKAF